MHVIVDLADTYTSNIVDYNSWETLVGETERCRIKSFTGSFKIYSPDDQMKIVSFKCFAPWGFVEMSRFPSCF